MLMTEWPCLPERLTDIWKEDLIKFFQSGAAVRMKVPVSVVELRPGHGGTPEPCYIPTIDPWLNYTSFCKFLREVPEKGAATFPGGDAACQACDCEHALGLLQGRLKPEPGHTGVAYRCHMGLWDCVAPINVVDRRVAGIFGGQRRPESPAEVAEIRRRVDAIGTDKSSIKCAPGAKEELKKLIEKIPLAEKGLLENLEREARSIAEFATERRKLLKMNLEEEFLGRLKICDAAAEPALNEDLIRLLKEIVDWCGVEFAMVFATDKPGKHVFGKVHQVGLPGGPFESALHFNWRKAELPGFEAGTFEEVIDSRCISKGIRGSQAKAIVPKIGFAYAVSLVTEHRMVFCLGRRRDGLDLASETEFLKRLAGRVSHPYLERQQFLEVRSREEQWEDAAGLIGHQVRSSLQAILAETDMVRERMGSSQSWVSQERASQALDTVAGECDALAAYSSELLEFWHWFVGKNHWKFKKRSLAETVRSCVARLAGVASREHTEIRVDPAVNELPEVETLGKTLEIAIGNILENAIKYSFDNRYIEVRGRFAKGLVSLEIENYGIGIPESERERVFEKRYRGKHRGRMIVREGEGLGAWQASEIVRAHGGGIECFSKSGDRQPQPGDVHCFKTVFTITLPVDQSKRIEEEI
jgi:signal transduction histidine kinase